MTIAISSWGTLLQIGDGATPENFTTIAEVLDLNPPALAQDTEEVTSHDSPLGWAEHIGTILRGGEVTFDINYEPTEATHDAATGLIADMVARTVRNFHLVLPDVAATTWAFSALVKGFVPAAPVKGALRASVSMLVSGQPTLA